MLFLISAIVLSSVSFVIDFDRLRRPRHARVSGLIALFRECIWYRFYSFFGILAVAQTGECVRNGPWTRGMLELVRRAKRGKLFDSQVRQVVQLALERQGKTRDVPPASDCLDWATLLDVLDERARLAGDEHQRYFDQMVYREIRGVRPAVRSGDPLPIEWDVCGRVVDRRFRVKHRGYVRVYAARQSDGARTLLCEGWEGSRRPDEHWRNVFLSNGIGGGTGDESEVWRELSTRLYARFQYFHASVCCAGGWPFAVAAQTQFLESGLYRIELETDDTLSIEKSLTGQACAPLFHSIRRTLSAPFQVLPREALFPITLIADQNMKARLAERMSLASASYGGPLPEHRSRVNFSVKIKGALPCGIAFRLFGVVEGVEYEAGTVACSKDGGFHGRRPVDEFELLGSGEFNYTHGLPAEVSAILRPDRDLALRTVGVFDMYDGEMTLGAVKVEDMSWMAGQYRVAEEPIRIPSGVPFKICRAPRAARRIRARKLN